MQGLVGVPRIVQHLRPSMIVCRHSKGILLGKLHHHQGLRLIFLVIGMRTVVEVRIVSVEVGIIGIVATGAIDGVVASVIGAVGVGAGRDENVELVEQCEDSWVVAGAKLIDEAKHEHHACQLVAMDSGSVEELGLAVRLPVVEATKHKLATACQCPQLEICASLGIVGSILLPCMEGGMSSVGW